MNEIELKLQVTGASADLIKESGILPHEGRNVQQRSAYFDTADGALAKAQISLRIRQIGDGRIQTIKANGGGAAGLFSRSEWEIPVQDNVPVIDGTTPVQAVLAGTAVGLTQVLLADVARQIWDVKTGDAAFEVVLDRGTLIAGDRQTEICEIELELKSGQVQALFDLARQLNGAAPVHLGVLTKAERGFRLMQALPTSVKSAPVSLAADMTAAEALQAILQSCIQQFRLNEDLLFPARSPEALHQARVALRRLRSAFSIFKPLLGSAAAQDLRDGLRQLAAELGTGRDLDVLLQRANPGPLAHRLRAEREAAYDRVEGVLGTASTRVLMLNLTEWICCGPWLTDQETDAHRRMPARTFATLALDRFRRKVKKGGRNITAIDDETRHDLRKDAKKLRYAADFFAPLFDGQHGKSGQKKFMAALEDVQDQLGALNDLAAAPQLLADLGISDSPEVAALLAGGKKNKLLRAAADAHETLISKGRYWERGR